MVSGVGATTQRSGLLLIGRRCFAVGGSCRDWVDKLQSSDWLGFYLALCRGDTRC